MKKISFIISLSVLLFSCSGNVQIKEGITQSNPEALQKKLDAAIAAFAQSITQLCDCKADESKNCDALRSTAEQNRVELDSTHANYDLTYEFGTQKGNEYYNRIDSLNTAYTNCK